MDKERYINLCDRQIKDTQDNSQAFMGISSVCKRLNKQSNRIKELAEENQQLKQQLEEKNKEIKKLSLYSEKLYKLQARIGLEERTVGDVVEELDRLRNQLELSQKENQQLKQSQKQLAIEELRHIKEYILINDKYDEEAGCNIIETFDLLEDIRDRIEKLGGEEK